MRPGLFNTRFLIPEPPREDEDVEGAWVDRERELQQALFQVDASLADPPRKPMAIVGSARVGKSHLMRRVELVCRSEFSLSIRTRITYNYRDIRALLVAILDQVIQRFQEVIAQSRSLKKANVLAPVLDLRNRFSPLLMGEAQELVILEGDSVLNTLSLTLGGKGKAKVASQVISLGTLLGLPVAEIEGELGIGGQGERATGRSTQKSWKYASMDEERLTRMIGLVHRLVREKVPDWKTLLVVDDFDLLKRDGADGLDPQPLLRALGQLAEVDGLFLLTTVRQDTYKLQQKDFFRLVELRPFQNPQFLSEIYKNHVRLWGPEKPPFRDSFVTDAAVASHGRVGLFLEVLRDAFQHHGGEVPQELNEYLQGEWAWVKEQEPEKATLVEEAVRAKQGRIDPEVLKKLGNSVIRGWIFEDYSSHDTAQVNFILQQFLLQA